MFDEQVNTLATIIQNEDLKKYAGNAFWNLVSTVISKNPVTGVRSIKDVEQLVFHIPTAIFWNKMERFLNGTYKNLNEQVKMASSFNNDNAKYTKFVKKQVYIIDKLDDDRKVDYFALLTRCMLLQELDIALYFKLAHIINQCTSFELEYIRSTDIDRKQENNAMISSLYQYGLIEQEADEKGTYYIFSGYAKALKGDCLNYGDENNYGVIKTYKDVKPLDIAEPIVRDKIVQMFK